MSVTPFLVPFTMTVAGSTGAGKTSFVRRLLRCRDTVFDKEIVSVVYFYTMWQSAYAEMKEEFGDLIRFVEGLPEEEEVRKIGNIPGEKCIILDDLMSAVSSDKAMENLFTRESHHYSISVIYVTQNIFAQGKSSRSIAVNVQYTVLMSNPRVSQIAALGQQFGLGKELKEAFLDATAKKRFRYLIFLASPRDESGYTMIAEALPDDAGPIAVYEPL